MALLTSFLLKDIRKVRKFCGLTPTFVEITAEKLVGMGVTPHPE